MSLQSVRVGLIGYGYAGKTFHAPLIATTPGFAFTHVSSSNAAKVHEDWPDVQVLPTPDALIECQDIDLVVVATPNNTHFPLAQKALLAGKHVVVDKPFTLTLNEAKRLDELAKEQGLLLSVFHNRRWDSDFLTVKALLEKQTLGQLAYFESHFDRYRPEVRQRWREQGGEGSGIWYDLGPHLLDQALCLFGQPEDITLDTALLRPEAQAVDYFHAALRYPGHRVVLHASMLAAAESPRFILHGTSGSFIKYGLDPQEEHLKAGKKPTEVDWGVDKRDGVITTLQDDGALLSENIATLPGNYPAFYHAVFHAIVGKGDNPVKAEEAIHVMALIELGLNSAREKKTVRVSL